MIKLEDLTKGYIYSELKNNYKEFEDINILNNVYFQECLLMQKTIIYHK